MTTPALTINQVSVGDTLPALVVEITPTTVVLGAIASRDWRPMHHDYKFATERNGVADIFLNTPNQAAWFERFITDWSGPTGRLGQMKFRMRDSVFPGDTMTLTGTVTAVDTDSQGCAWASVEVELTATSDRRPQPQVCSTCSVRVALPSNDGDNPWSRRGDEWQPRTAPPTN